jgi:hypothetical protein
MHIHRTPLAGWLSRHRRELLLGTALTVTAIVTVLTVP